MPGRSKNHARADIAIFVEDIEQKLVDAASAASAVSCELDNGTNPKELCDAWAQVEHDLIAIRDRVRKLAR